MRNLIKIIQAGIRCFRQYRKWRTASKVAKACVALMRYGETKEDEEVAWRLYGINKRMFRDIHGDR